MDSHNHRIEPHVIHRQASFPSYCSPPLHLTELTICYNKVGPHHGEPTPHSQAYSHS
jgi:hypothetical protein